MAGGGGGTNTVTRTELDPTMRPYVQYGLSEAQRLYQTPNVPQYYPGQTYIGPSQQTTTALEAAQTRATMGNPLVPAAQQQLLGTIQGNFLGANPYLEAALQPAFGAAQRQFESATNQALSNFSRAGRYGSGAMRGALTNIGGEFGRALTGAAGQLGYANYADERARQMAATQMAPAMAAQDYADIQRLANVGQQTEAYQEMALQDAINRFNFAQQAPYARLQSFLSGAYGAPSGMQQVTPVYRNPLAGAVGGALTGAALGGTDSGSMFSPQQGALGGALLGGLLR
jgi:hypothetical protein